MARLGDICIVVSGTTPKSSCPEYWDGDINWVTPAELNDESDVIYESQRKITKQAVIDSSLKPFPLGTVLLSSRAPIGKVAIAGTEMYCNQGFKNLICSDAIYNRYLYHFLKSKTEYLNSLGRGATFKEISKSIVEEIEIPLPPLEEQHRIASLLDKVSDLIAKRRAQLDKLDLLVKSRFVEMFWDIDTHITAEEACEVIVDCPHSTPKYIGKNKIYPAIRTSEIKNGQIDWTSMLYVDAEEYKQRTKRLVPLEGDIVYAREGTYGDCVILPKQHRFCLGQRTMLFRPNYNICTSEYLHQVLRSDAVKRQADESNAGSTVPHVNVADAKKFAFPLPSLEKQKEFSNFVERTDKSKLTIQQSLNRLETLKKALMQQYFG